MVRADEVAVRTASEAVRHTPLEIQAAWTAEDVKREGRKIVTAQSQPKSQQPAKAAKPFKPAKRIPPPRVINYSTIDVGDLSNAHILRPGQRVFIHPPHIYNLLDDASNVGLACTEIANIDRRRDKNREGIRLVEPSEFSAALDRLLTYQPVKGKTNGEQVDFAREARKSLDYVAPHLDGAIEWLTGIREVINQVLKPQSPVPQEASAAN